MFELLKKKLSSFAEKLKATIEKKETVQPQPVQDSIKEEKIPKMIAEEPPKTKIAAELLELTEKEIKIEKELKEADEKTGEKRTIKIEEQKPAKTPTATEEKKRELKANVGVTEKIKSVFKGFVELKESDLEELVFELELSLLESDVEQATAQEISAEIKKELVGKNIPTGKNLNDFVREEIKKVLKKIMNVEKTDLLSLAAKKKPFILLFLGPNGAGKTTTIAKLTFFMQQKGKSVVWAAADTFRAASIEQLEKHAEKLKVRVVKHKYGADPAAVAFDAARAAESGKNDFVFIDSAGRQETNKNLMEEIKKIVRVAKPDLKIYVGESLTGQALLQQASEFNKAIGIDGFILTKIDCDPKGGTTISLLYKLKKPILFVGTGQEYKNLEAFEPDFVLNKII